MYSAIPAYLTAMQDAQTVEGERVVEAMRRPPIQDPLFGAVTVWADSRAVHDIHRFQVKAPADSHGPYDHCMLLATIPAASAFRPLTQGGCPTVKPL